MSCECSGVGDDRTQPILDELLDCLTAVLVDVSVV